MPVFNYIQQPASGSIVAAYRPIVLIAAVAGLDYSAAPPVVYCDVYVNGTYYKSLEKTQYTTLRTSDSLWQFDIQDVCQEVLKKVLAPNGNSTPLKASDSICSVYCKIRTSANDGEGFVVVEEPVPVQGSAAQAPIAGAGFKSSVFIVVNTVLQHDNNQNLSTHLSYFRTGTWQPAAFPLTHRPNQYFISKKDSNFFPVLITNSSKIRCLQLDCKPKIGIVPISQTYCFACQLAITSLAIAIDSNGFFALTWTNVNDLPYGFQFVYSTDGGTTWIAVAMQVNSTTKDGATCGQLLDATIDYDWRVLPLCGPNDPGSAATVHYTPAPCTGVTIGAYTLPNGQAGSYYEAVVLFTGTAPVSISNISKSSWLNDPVLAYNSDNTGGTVTFAGTPSGNDLGTQSLNFQLNNCTSGVDSFGGSFVVAQPGAEIHFQSTGGDEDYDYETGTVTGIPGAVLTIKVIQLINNNGGTLTVDGSQVFQDSQFTKTIGSNGSTTFPAVIHGDHTKPGGSVILGKFQIIAVSTGIISGSSNIAQISKVF